MPIEPSPVPAHVRGRPFSTRESELSPRRLRGADLRAPHHGARSTGPRPTDLVDRCRELLPVLRPRTVFSHTTAALLHGMPVPTRWEREQTLHVGVPAGRRPPRRPGVIGHEVGDLESVEVHGLPVLAAVETWCSMAGVLTEAELVAAADWLLRPGAPDVATAVERLSAAAARPGRRFTGRMRGAVRRARPGVRSPQETALRLVLVDADLPEPTVAFVVRSPTGAFVAEVDLAYPAERIALEYEGAHHRTDPVQWAKDIRRREMLEDLGWTVIRITAEDLGPRRAALIARVRLRLARTRAW